MLIVHIIRQINQEFKKIKLRHFCVKDLLVDKLIRGPQPIS